MTALFAPPFVLSYATEPGFVLLARTHAGVTEMVGGPLDFQSGERQLGIGKYATAISASSEAEAVRAMLRKPDVVVALGTVTAADAAEALQFLDALADCYRHGTSESLTPEWRGAAAGMLNAVPPLPIQALHVLADGAAGSRYDW